MRTGRAGVRDGVIALCVAATTLIAGRSENHAVPDLDLLGHLLLAAAGLALVARRRAPVTVLAVTGVCAVGYQAIGFDVPAVAFLFAVYAAVRAGHRLITVAVSVAMLAALPLAALASPHDWPVAEAFAQARGALEVAWLIAAGAAGEALRQAERRADEAERTREETARRRADEERLHIARELHDSLTHQISVIKVQAEAAVHVARKRGEPVPDALLAIREAGREASRELRATLEALRDDRTPPHGLDHVPELVERVRATGLDATLTIAGQRPEVPAAVDRTAYRIVQESLTNIARHASAATASVRIDYGPDALAIRVDDDGTGTPDAAPVPGVGLLGMRERVAALGGRLRAEPRGEGGFTVQAELPVGRTP
ncbi:sensor histidine kinase [Jidongwangia harbinensis]|uniref:sensor histidine kinase n=1 Tax=Jidongwangia harbinensis TaxID=2878561 RepID=UPI001CDA335E|nr:sensor histidine kinase [Jidongwangia harbinensis]MCA2213507.1 sensor histidine kinase [Jidongwangia harbinensis]